MFLKVSNPVDNENNSDSSDESINDSSPRYSSSDGKAIVTKKGAIRSPKSVKQKGRDALSPKKTVGSPKKKGNGTSKAPKRRATKQLFDIEKILPLVSQRPKRHRINN
ncbi:hypothetical protein NPIL_422671 [Nephila pilipes]|uniref:Uncharacterized protein n=1 Tax=Nephila pilipes TaxID=299642 RepID=A0A8X6T6H0_NEPPI|nr:hypothetical protein NPIL_422671 [Nephila pilipes]